MALGTSDGTRSQNANDPAAAVAESEAPFLKRIMKRRNTRAETLKGLSWRPFADGGTFVYLWVERFCRSLKRRHAVAWLTPRLGAMSRVERPVW